MRGVLLAFMGALLLPGCGGGGGAPTVGTSSQGQSTGAAASYTVELPYQKAQLVSQERVGLTLTALNDSRCRAGAQCVWAGEVQLSVSVSLPGVVPESVDVTLSSSSKQAVKVREYALSLVRVDPTPVPQNAALSSYVVTVQLDKPAPGGG